MLINNVADYVITRLHDSDETLSNLKLQKLLYYIEAWHVTLYNETPLFADDEFQAWVHGPVTRAIYDRFAEKKSLYSDIELADRMNTDPARSLSEPQRLHVDLVLESYAKFSGSQLEEMTHNEEPWIEARQGCKPWERCDRVISKATMAKFYSERLRKTA